MLNCFKTEWKFSAGSDIRRPVIMVGIWHSYWQQRTGSQRSVFCSILYVIIARVTAVEAEYLLVFPLSTLQVRYTVSQKNVPPLACYNFDAHECILIFFGRNVTDKVGNQKTLYYATSNNLCFCTTWQNAETRKSHFTQLDCVTHAIHLCAVFLKEKMSSVMCLIASNIC